MKFSFQKYHGAGNDFIITGESTILKLDEISRKILIPSLCHRRFGIGADGLIVVRRGVETDLQINFFNSDGVEGSFCGNGSRCSLHFALHSGLVEKGNVSFKYGEEVYISNCCGDDIKIQMKDVSIREYSELGFRTDTGSPHLIIEENFDVEHPETLKKRAIELRHRKEFAPGGLNVNFLNPGLSASGEFRIKTFERGVEDFTYACGTGAVAIAAYLAWKKGSGGEFKIRSEGGLLTVKVGSYSDQLLSDIWLSGPVTLVYEGMTDLSMFLKPEQNLSKN